MVNLFRQGSARDGNLTAALLALLEHSDRDLLNAFLRRADLPHQVSGETDLQVIFPVPEGPTDRGLLVSPHFRITLQAQTPDAPWSPPIAPDPDLVLVSLAGQATEGARTLTWEQVDRWLAGTVEQFDPESRTGFLVRQFRDFLRESGIDYFPGFVPSELDQAPHALETLNQFYRTAEAFFDRLFHILAVTRRDTSEIRRARPEDLIAGYPYRDFSGPPYEPGAFLRAAFHLPDQELQVSVWLAPGRESHTRLRAALTGDPAFVSSLRKIEGHPLLRLWSPGGERQLPLEDLDPADLADLDWSLYQSGIQVSLPFRTLASEGLANRVARRAHDLARALSPLVVETLH